MKEGRLPKRQYTEECKAEAVRLAASVGGHEAARRLGVPVATVGNWSRRGIASAAISGAAVPGEALARHPVSELEAENGRLRRELAEAKLDVEILRKSDGVLRQGVAMKYAWIDKHRDQYTAQAWVADITYVATGEGWLYLAAAMDLAGRRIVGWSMSETIDATLVCTALKSAWWQRKPPKGLLVHSDRGAQYASGRYRALAADLGITMSMRRKANAWDNAPMESFFKTLKVERIYQVRYDTRAQARLDIVDWIEGWYNRQRLRSANGFLASVTWQNAPLAA